MPNPFSYVPPPLVNRMFMEEHKVIFWLFAGVLVLLILPSEARLPQKWDFWYKGFFLNVLVPAVKPLIVKMKNGIQKAMHSLFAQA